jgi:hypothetical protein
MNTLLVRSVRLYERLLLLYPRELRCEFGSEMILAFADDLETAWGDARIAGVAQVWWYALRELLTVALPAQRSNRSVLVPALSFLLAASTQSTELYLAYHQVARVDAFWLLDSIRFAVLLPSLLSACVGLIVTRVNARSSIAALHLD